MGSYIVSQNGSIEIGLLDDYRDNGWIVSNKVAIHSGCNQGKIVLKNYSYVVGVPNVFKFVVSGYSSGLIRLQVGGQNGSYKSSNGTYIETITPNSEDEVSFWSDGNLSVELLEIYTDTVEQTAVTLGFDEKSNKWVSYYSYPPDMLAKFKSKFFMWSNGQLWESHTNEQYNTFFGVSYPSRITFFVNINPTEVKEFFSMRQKSNKVWSVTEAYIEPQEGKKDGQLTRIKKGNFKNLQGDWFAKFMRNMNDPRFNNELDALIKGGSMQGSVMRVTIENNDTVQVRLLSVDVEVAAHNYTY